MILANDFSSGLIRFQKLLAQMANRVLVDLARAVEHIMYTISLRNTDTLMIENKHTRTKQSKMSPMFFIFFFLLILT